MKRMLSISLFTAVALLAVASLAFGQSYQDIHGVGTDGCAPSPLDGTSVSVTGIVYVVPGVYNAGSVYWQAAGGGAGGCTLFDSSLAGVVSEGDEINVTGDVSFFGAEIELINTVVTVVTNGNAIVSTPIATGDLAAGTDLLGDFLQVTGTLALVSTGFNSTYTVDDGSGPVTVFIDGTTLIDTATTLDPYLGDIVTVKGSTKCFNGEGELLPRRDADITLTAVPAPTSTWGSLKAQF